MPGRFDESLLASPLDEQQPARWSRSVGVVAAVVIVATFAIGVWIVATDGALDPVEATLSSTVASTTVPALVAREADEQFLYHPMLLPQGFELCAGSLGRPTTGDEFCDPTDPSRWIEVATPSIRANGTAIDGFPGFVLASGVEPYGIVVDEVGLVVTGVGISLDQLIEVTASIPLADLGRWVAPEEDPITEEITDEFVRLLLGAGVGDLEIRRGPGQSIEVYGSGLNLYSVSTGSDATDDIRSMAAGLVRPQFLSDQRAFVVGGSEPNGSVAVWYQRGRYWHIASSESRYTLIQQVGEMESRIAGLS